MSQRIDHYTVDNVLDLLDRSDSELEGFGNETDDEFIPYEQDLSFGVTMETWALVRRM